MSRTRLVASLSAVLGGAAIVVGCGVGPSIPSVAPSVAPSAAPSAAASVSLEPTPTPSGAASAVDLALTERFTSAIHGITVAYPAGWTTRPATEPLATTEFPLFDSPVMDVVFDPARTDHLFLGMLSQALGTKSLDAWAAYFLAAGGCVSTEPVTISGSAGIIGTTCNLAAVGSEDRGYVVWLYASDDVPGLDGAVLFMDILDTVSLDPEAAIDPAQ